MLKENIDQSVSPGADFYYYANGNWLKNNPIPDDQARWGSFDALAMDNMVKLRNLVEELSGKTDLSQEQKNLCDFYMAAMDSEKAEKTGLAKLQEVFAKVENIKNPDDLTAFIAESTLEDSSTPWDIMIEPDEKKSDQYVLRFEQDGLGLPDRDYYFKEEHKEIRGKYLQYIETIFSALNHPAPQFAPQIMAFETKLAEASMTQVQRRDIEAQYNKMSFEQLQEKYPNINWQIYLDKIGVAKQDIIVNQPVFMAAMDNAFAAEDLSSWKIYLKFHAYLGLASTFGEKFDQLDFDFYSKAIYGQKIMKPRWYRSIGAILACMDDPLDKLFVAKYFPPEAKARMQELIEDIRAAFAHRITALAWMKEETKKYALGKLAKINVKIGYPEVWIDRSKIQIGPESYVQNAINASVFEVRRQLDKLGQPINTTEWLMSASVVNAYAYFNLNEIAFPAGILQPPFFDFHADDAVNYGGIGTVIAHELTHGFDDIGSQFGDDGNLFEWRTAEDKQEFHKRSEVVVQQADKYEVLPRLFLNGKLTLGENIADLGGIEIAFEALQRALKRKGDPGLIEGMTAQQRFFLSYARTEAGNIREELSKAKVVTDPHAPGRFRVNGPLANCDGFYQAFGITEKDQLYIPPEHRARIW